MVFTLCINIMRSSDPEISKLISGMAGSNVLSPGKHLPATAQHSRHRVPGLQP